jgi:hypothetical protein
MGFTYTYSDPITNTDLTNVDYTLTDGNTVSTIDSSVVTIAAGAFNNVRSVLTGVDFSLATNFHTISSNMFSQCTKLTSVTIPDAVNFIGNSAFVACSSLTSITDLINVTSIGSSAFEGCGFETFTWPSKVTTISNNMFNGCLNLTIVTIPSTVTIIGSGVFSSCGFITFPWPSSVTSISNNMFTGCTKLTMITGIDGIVNNIGSTAFQGCGFETFAWPHSITTISTSMFLNCTKLTSVTGLNNVNNVGSSAFQNCGFITFTLPSKVTTISSLMFFQCYNLTSITIPSTVTIIVNYAFFLCNTLASITIGPGVILNSNSFGQTSANITNSLTTMLHEGYTEDQLRVAGFNNEAINAAVAAATNFTYTYSDPSNTILTNVVYDHGSYVSTIDSSVVTIDANAFNNVKPVLTGVDFSFATNFHTIYDNTFQNYVALTSITINLGVSLGSNSFAGTTSINNENYSSLTTMLLQGYNSNQLSVAKFDSGAISAAAAASCFNEDTKILCLNNNVEEYIPVQNLRKGDLVKTYLHGYKKIELIGKSKLRNDINNIWNNRMFIMYKTEENGLTEDLIMTGGHSILVDKLTEEEINYYKSNNIFNGEGIKIDDKYLLLAGVSNQFISIEDNNVFTYYNFCLENDGDNDKRFGVYANGILAEIPSTSQFTDFKKYTFY